MRVWLLPWDSVGNSLYEMEVPDEEQPVRQTPEWYMEVATWLDMIPVEGGERSEDHLSHMGVIFLSENIPDPFPSQHSVEEEIDWKGKEVKWNGVK